MQVFGYMTSFSFQNRVNRISRDFIKNSATLEGGTLIGSLPIGVSVHVSGIDLLKVALVGCGGCGTGTAVQVLRTEGSVELVAMADVFRDKLNSSYDNLMNIPDIRESINVPEKRRFAGFDAFQTEQRFYKQRQ